MRNKKMKTFAVIEMVTLDLGGGEFERCEKIVFEGSMEDCKDMWTFFTDLVCDESFIEDEDTETDFRIGHVAKAYERWCDWDD